MLGRLGVSLGDHGRDMASDSRLKNRVKALSPEGKSFSVTVVGSTRQCE